MIPIDDIMTRYSALVAIAPATTDREQVDTEIGRMDEEIGELLRFSRINPADVAARRLIRLDSLLTDLIDTEKVKSAARECDLTLASDAGLAIAWRVFELHDGSVEALAREGGGLIIRARLLEAQLQ